MSIWLLILIAGFIAIMLMLQVEAMLAHHYNRKPEPLTVLVLGVVDIGYFLAMLLARGLK